MPLSAALRRARPLSPILPLACLLSLPCLTAHGDAPAQAQTPLWRVGTPDANDAEFALAPGDYSHYSGDGFFVVGRSDSRNAWPYVQPGPADNWAGSRKHAFRINFGLKIAPRSGTCRLEIALLDTQAVSPPRLRIQINGFTREVSLPPGHGDASVSGRPAAGKPYRLTVSFPASVLMAGVNRVTLTTLTGSWMLYDAVTLWTPPGLEIVSSGPYWFGAIEPHPLLVRDTQGKLAQIVTAHLWNFAAPTEAHLRINGTDHPVHLASGKNSLEIRVPEVQRETPTRIVARIGGHTVADAPITLRPVKHWEVYLLPHSHVDIGYTDLQENVRQKQIDNLHAALNLIRQSKSYPGDARFKWNLEVMWPIDGYLRAATPTQRQEFREAVHGGVLGLDAYYGNLLTGLCSGPELLHASDETLAVARAMGVPMDAAMQDDVPGYTWGNVTALSEAGVKYLSLGPNSFDRMGSTLIRWHDRPFYWLSPSGKRKILVWMTYDGYALGVNIGGKLTPFLPGYLDGLEERRYPYDIACLQWHVNGDNGAPDENLAATVRDWNARYAYPHLIIATTREPFVALEKRYRNTIPAYRGDFTPYWEDGAASTARETALNRNASARLTQAEALWAMTRSPAAFPADAFRKAWDDILLYSEHTWGSWGSIDDPDEPSVRAQWAYKSAFAVHADAESKRLLNASTASSSSGQIDVVNTESWKRTDIVLVPQSLSRTGDLVRDASGHPVPSQRLASGDLAILVRDIPPLSRRRYTILAGAASSTSSGVSGVSAKENTLRSSALSVRVDPITGAIVEMHAAGIPGNLAGSGTQPAINEYLYLLGGDRRQAQRNGPVTIRVDDPGPLVATLRITSSAPGGNSLTRRVRIVQGLFRVDLDDTVDKQAVRAKEGVHFGFGFNVPNPIMRMDMPLSVVRPEQDQLPASNKNWYPVQHWVDISNSRYGVTWATVDAPLVEVGSLTATLPGFVGQDDPRWLAHIASSSTLYSWVMNNHWHTNYKADQAGPVTFRYSIEPHGASTPDAAARFGQGISHPLLAQAATGTPDATPLLTVSTPGVIVKELKPSNDGKACIVRLWGASGKSESVRLTWRGKPLSAAFRSDSTEKRGERLGPLISVAGYELVTVRIES